MKDPYAVLGVAKNATVEQVKEAYRELAPGGCRAVGL